MKKSLFDENDKFTEEASKLEAQVYPAIKAAFDRIRREGYSIRDAAHIIELTVQMAECETVLEDGSQRVALRNKSPTRNNKR